MNVLILLPFFTECVLMMSGSPRSVVKYPNVEIQHIGSKIYIFHTNVNFYVFKNNYENFHA